MWTRLLIVALALPFALTAPVHAQSLAGQGSARAISSDVARPHDPREVAPGIFSSTSAGVRVARDAYVIEDGTADVRRGVVGVLPLGETVSLGVGLYKVSRYSRRDPDFKRLMPMEDTDGRRQKIAAVGLNVRF